MFIVNLTATSFHPQRRHVFLNIMMTMATKAQHAHTNMPSNNQVPYWKSHATVSTIFSFSQVFTKGIQFRSTTYYDKPKRHERRRIRQQ